MGTHFYAILEQTVRAHITTTFTLSSVFALLCFVVPAKPLTWPVLCFCQLQVIVNDGFCVNPDQDTLTVNVRRNLFPPTWTGQGPDFIVTVLETQDILSRIIQLTATDQDQTGVRSFSLFFV